MVLGGLWHGAAWTFVLWGTFNGLGLVAEHAWGGRVALPGWLRWFVTFNLIVFGWVLFRAQSLADFGALMSRLTVFTAPTLWTIPVLAMIVLVVGLQLLPPDWVERLQVRIESARPLLLGVGLAVVIAFVAATVPSQGVPPFIYFRF
jgi:alginate O-acetyltransferase complex protein AlgI